MKTVIGSFMLALGMFVFPAPAHASTTCTQFYTPAEITQWKPCIQRNNASCRQITAGILGGIGGGGGHVTCTYPDGGRDECDFTGVAWTNTMNSGRCDHIEP